jgi:hypothetical protein
LTGDPIDSLLHLKMLITRLYIASDMFRRLLGIRPPEPRDAMIIDQSGVLRLPPESLPVIINSH